MAEWFKGPILADMEKVDKCMGDIPKCLNKLENSISNLSSSYEKKENWKFNLVMDWITLDLDIDKKQLVSALKLTHKIISLYMKSWYTNEQLYTEESILTKWQIDRSSIIDMKIDNRLIFDTTFLSEEWFKDSFLLDPTRSNWIMLEYADFLNKVLAKLFTK